MNRPVRNRIVRRALHGVLLLDKPLGWSSNDALQKAKWLLRAEKAGHTGTLDPLATGLLPLCFGAATKFSQISLDADKRYLATLHLGQRTSTGDREGEVTETRPLPADLSLALLQAAVQGFVGPILQLPPMHSALKKDGKALYEYARAGQVVEREPRPVTVMAITIVSWQGSELVLDVACTKGTYIRTLAEDIGEALGCGAHLSGLRRTAAGLLTIDCAEVTTLAQLEALPDAERASRLLPVDAMLQGFDAVHLPADEAVRFLTGLRRRLKAADAAAVRVYGPGVAPGGAPGAVPGGVLIDGAAASTEAAQPVFLGSAHIVAGELIPSRLMSPTEL